MVVGHVSKEKDFCKVMYGGLALRISVHYVDVKGTLELSGPSERCIGSL